MHSNFVITVRVKANVRDVVRNLRAWLKIGLRTFGLRCVSIEEVKQIKQENIMDMRKYTTGYIMPDDVRDGARRERIINVYISDKRDAFVLELESGDQFTVWFNSPNARTLSRAYGFESNDWLGHEIELSLGTYVNKDEETKEFVALKPISTRQPSPDNGGAKAVVPAPRRSSQDDMDDSIPFS
jgi:hypothetical protein